MPLYFQCVVPTLEFVANYYLLIQVAPHHLSSIKRKPELFMAWLIQLQESPYQSLPSLQSNSKGRFSVHVGLKNWSKRKVLRKLRRIGLNMCRLIYLTTCTSAEEMECVSSCLECCSFIYLLEKTKE